MSVIYIDVIHLWLLFSHQRPRRAKEVIEQLKFMSNPDSSGVAPAQIQTDSPALNLDNDNFKTSIDSQEPTLVFFYATWCSACNKFKPIYLDVAIELAGKSPLRFAIYDCSDGGAISEEYGISRFPTLKLFRGGKYERDFDGKSNQEDLKQFVVKFVS